MYFCRLIANIKGSSKSLEKNGPSTSFLKLTLTFCLFALSRNKAHFCTFYVIEFGPLKGCPYFRSQSCTTIILLKAFVLIAMSSTLIDANVSNKILVYHLLSSKVNKLLADDDTNTYVQIIRNIRNANMALVFVIFYVLFWILIQLITKRKQSHITMFCSIVSPCIDIKHFLYNILIFSLVNIDSFVYTEVFLCRENFICYALRIFII